MNENIPDYIPASVVESRVYDVHDQIMEKIRDLMNKGMTLSEIARRCNTHGSKLSIMVNHKKELWNCHLRTLVGLAIGLGINISIGEENGKA